MNKTKMVKNVASEADVENKVVETVMNAYGKFVLGVLSENRNEKIILPGLGAFSVKHVPEKNGIVQLGEKKGSEWHKDAHDEIQFKITKSVKEL